MQFCARELQGSLKKVYAHRAALHEEFVLVVVKKNWRKDVLNEKQDARINKSNTLKIKINWMIS